MIRLHYSNRLENLIAPLAEAVAAHQRCDPLERRVDCRAQSRGRAIRSLSGWLKGSAIAANLKFPFLRSYLAELLQSTDKNLKILEADDLQLVLFECLRSTDHRDDPGLKPARDYILGGSKTDADVELRTLLLAAQLARLFREYSISRRRMIGRWRAARRSDVDAMSETERWQRHLWQLVFDSHGRVREEWIRHRETRLMMLPDAFEATEDCQLKAALPDMLHIFSSSYAGNAYADIFARLGALGDVRIYALNPCREFWEDVDTSRRSAFAGWAHRQDKVGEKIDESEDPFSLNESSDPPALRLWGRPGREYIRLLNELSQCDFAPLFSDPVSRRDTASILEELQQNILDRAPQPANIEDGRGQADGMRESVFSPAREFGAKPKSSRTKSGRSFATTKNLPPRARPKQYSLSRNRGADSRLGGRRLRGANRKRLSKAAPNPDRSGQPHHLRARAASPKRSSCFSNCRAVASRARK